MSRVPDNSASLLALRMKLKRLHKQLEDCQGAYAREKNKLGGTSGAAEYEIEKTLDRYETRIGELDNEIMLCRRQLQMENVSSLILCLKSSYAEAEERQTINQVFYQSLPPNSPGRSESIPNDISIIIKTLANSIQDSHAPYKPLVMFVGGLLQKNNLFIPGLREWLTDALTKQTDVDAIDSALDECLAQIQSYIAQRQIAKSCLLIRVTNSAQGSTQENQREYTIRGWYIEDIQQYRLNFGSASDVYLPGDTPDAPLTFETNEIEAKIRDLIDACFEKGWNAPDSLQLFFPSELMDLPVDTWCSDPDEDFEGTLGIDYSDGVLIRCNDRLSDKKVDRRLWKQRWQLLEKCSNYQSSKLFSSSIGTNIAALKRQIRKEQDKVFGLKLIPAISVFCQDGTAKKQIFRFLSKSYVPATVWLRQEPASVTCDELLNELLSSCCLKELPEKVYDRRLDLDHVGQHLSLMWDDPYLLPPDFQQPQSA
ncbi:hypothetical protein Lepto7375DRAFT_0745 [Leptolyngbya sp. PCC 7375]|nr:hypothetical protein Lepto7375DRAFT_0745 [Leptolyngbya sp. PCC 7375]